MPGSPESRFHGKRTGWGCPQFGTTDNATVEQEFLRRASLGYFFCVGFRSSPTSNFRYMLPKDRPASAEAKGKAVVFDAREMLAQLRTNTPPLEVKLCAVHEDHAKVVYHPGLRGMVRHSQGFGATAALALVFCLVALSLFSGLGRAGNTPIAPNASSPGAQIAFGAMGAGNGAFQETWLAMQQFSPLFTGHYTLTTGYSNATGWTFPSSLTAQSYAFQYWVNYTSGCPNNCPAYTMVCDGHSVSPTHGTVPCQSVVINYNGVTVNSLPVLNISRLQTWTFKETVTWTTQSGGASTTSNTYVFGPGIFNTVQPKFTGWFVPSISWATPLPGGTYDLSRTAVEFLNTSTLLTSSQFLAQSTYILIQWSFPYPSSCVRCDPPISHNQLWQYLFEIVNAGNTVTNSGNLLSPPGTNISIPPGLPPTTIPDQTEVVQGVAPQATSAGNYSMLVTWSNPFTLHWSGPWQITSRWWCLSQFASRLVGQSGSCLTTGLVIQANGIPLATTKYAMAYGSVYVYPGATDVPNGSAVAFLLTFHYVTTIDPTGATVLINRIPLNLGDFSILIGSIATAAILLKELANPALRKSRPLSASLGVALLTVAIPVLLYL